MFQSDKILKSKLSEIEPEQAEFQTKKKKIKNIKTDGPPLSSRSDNLSTFNY